ncbi:hypothetical protein CR513_25043, partial [Mucuna pruriens]
MLHRCPYHDFPRGHVRGDIQEEISKKTYEIIENMTSNNYHYFLGDKHMIEVEKRWVIEQKLDALTKQIETLIYAYTQFMPPPSTTYE